MGSTALKIALIGHPTADLPPLAKSIADHGRATLDLPLEVTAFESAQIFRLKIIWKILILRFLR